VKRVTVALAFAAILVAVAGCSSFGSSAFTGTWGEDAPGEPFLAISDDGTFTGNDGCNDFEGTGTVSGDTFEFGPFATIQQACEGVDPWLNIAVTASVDGDTLTVYKRDGDPIGTLEKR
jgi:heat shock protein HslJ